MLTDGSTQYTYDPANRLTSITTASGTTTYAYNGDNDRVLIIEYVMGGYTESWPLILENAWALFKGGGDIVAGYTIIGGPGIGSGEALEALTGRRGKWIKKENLTVDNIGRLFDQGNLILLMSKGAVKEGVANIHGMVAHHTYPVAGVDWSTRKIILRQVWNWDAFGEIKLDDTQLSEWFSGADYVSGG